jgi:tRNA dimethylallyltransferase
VGKTDFVNQLIKKVPFEVEIINADVGQFYKPLTIGTAKPAYHADPIKHHLFDIVDKPVDYTVTDYRKEVVDCMQLLWHKKKVPLIVGGSGFYVQSLFFPPHEGIQTKVHASTDLTNEQLWNRLYSLDPQRASSIHRHDRYRIERALNIIEQRGTQASSFVPTFEPLGTCAFYFLTRERDDLYKRINERVGTMIDEGWFAEVSALDVYWHEFLRRKKLIGYPEIIAYLATQEAGMLAENSYCLLVEKIKQRTRAYAKRQLTFWKMLKKKLLESDSERQFLKICKEINLTLSPLDLYLKQLSDELAHLYMATKKESNGE